MNYQASLIIPTCNRQDLLDKALNSLILQNFSCSNFEIIWPEVYPPPTLTTTTGTITTTTGTTTATEMMTTTTTITTTTTTETSTSTSTITTMSELTVNERYCVNMLFWIFLSQCNKNLISLKHNTNL